MIRIKSYCIAIAVMLCSYNTNASVITYNNYSLDTDTNIVSSYRDIEWLRWSETLGMSIREALNIHGSEGWRLASNEEMARLLTDFFSGTYWNPDEETWSYNYFDNYTWGKPEVLGFYSLYGGSYNERYDQYKSSAKFGSDDDGDGFFRNVSTWSGSGVTGQQVAMGGDIHDYTYEPYVTLDTTSWGGVALVRDVPSPATLMILLTGLTMLRIRLRRSL